MTPRNPRRKPRVRPTRRSGRSRRHGRGHRGAVQEWVEQEQQLQRSGAWEVRAISAEAANHDLESRSCRANEDRCAADSRLADVTKERDRLVTRVKSLERNLGTARKAAALSQRH